MMVPGATVLPMPIREALPMTQSWIITWWPTGEWRPSVTPRGVAERITGLSWMLVRGPIEMADGPASRMLLYQMLEPSAAISRPVTFAVPAMKTDGCTSERLAAAE